MLKNSREAQSKRSRRNVFTPKRKNIADVESRKEDIRSVQVICDHVGIILRVAFALISWPFRQMASCAFFYGFPLVLAVTVVTAIFVGSFIFMKIFVPSWIWTGLSYFVAIATSITRSPSSLKLVSISDFWCSHIGFCCSHEPTAAQKAIANVASSSNFEMEYAYTVANNLDHLESSARRLILDSVFPKFCASV
jgi:hypothetical protein